MSMSRNKADIEGKEKEKPTMLFYIIIAVCIIVLVTMIFIDAHNSITRDAELTAQYDISEMKCPTLVIIDPITKAVYTNNVLTGDKMCYALDTITDVVYYYSNKSKKIVLTPIMNADGSCMTGKQLNIKYDRTNIETE